MRLVSATILIAVLMTSMNKTSNEALLTLHTLAVQLSGLVLNNLRRLKDNHFF